MYYLDASHFILKSTSAFLKNTFKSSLFRKKIEQIKYELLSNTQRRIQVFYLRCCSSPNPAFEQIILHYKIYLKKFMAAYLCSILLLLLILISFTALLYLIAKRLTLCFFNFDLFFCTISRANEWERTFECNFIIEIRTFFVALISELQTKLLKNSFMCKKIFDSKIIPPTGNFLQNFSQLEL